MPPKTRRAHAGGPVSLNAFMSGPKTIAVPKDGASWHAVESSRATPQSPMCDRGPPCWDRAFARFLFC